MSGNATNICGAISHTIIHFTPSRLGQIGLSMWCEVPVFDASQTAIYLTILKKPLQLWRLIAVAAWILASAKSLMV